MSGPDPTERSARVTRVEDRIHVRVRGGVFRLDVRGTTTTVLLVVAVVLLAVLALGLGDLRLSVGRVAQALFAPEGVFADRVVREWRLPRIACAIIFGACLALSGALFQSLTRNPLGSPDIIGFSTGSYTGALLVITVFGTSVASTSVGALVGGLATALVVYGLAYRGGMQGFRLIVVGIAVTAMLASFNTWLLLRAQTEVAMAASIWGAGSINLARWDAAVPVLVILLVLLPVVGVLAGPLRELELGDDAARAHGVDAERSRLGILVVAVALTAVVTAATGPIAFVSLAAPQIARRITRSAGLPLVGSAVTGSLLLLAADVIAQHALPANLPVGMVTVILGGAYLLWLLVHEARRPRR